jgi:ubiquitin-protein ligase
MASTIQTIYKAISLAIKEPNEFFTLDPDIENTTSGYKCKGIMFGHYGSYKGGIFKFEIIFPKEYPNKSPIFIFITKIFHPNIYVDGTVCISILHDGEDETNYEDKGLRWTPAQTLCCIIKSIHVVLHDPNDTSPANIDAAKMLKSNPEEYNLIIRKMVASTHN